jgi:hypothetical protein
MTLRNGALFFRVFAVDTARCLTRAQSRFRRRRRRRRNRGRTEPPDVSTRLSHEARLTQIPLEHPKAHPRPFPRAVHPRRERGEPADERRALGLIREQRVHAVARRPQRLLEQRHRLVRLRLDLSEHLPPDDVLVRAVLRDSPLRFRDALRADELALVLRLLTVRLSSRLLNLFLRRASHVFLKEGRSIRANVGVEFKGVSWS